MDAALNQRLDHVARDITRLVGERSGYLKAVTLSVPDGTPVAEVRRRMEERLADAGLDFVDVMTVPGEGPISLVDSRFEEEWAE